MQDKNLRQKLIDLGAEILADNLLSLASYYDEISDLTERLTATPEENIQRFKKKLSSLKRQKKFIGWKDSAHFAIELKMLLQDIEYSTNNPLTGVKLVASFYEADNAFLGRCDDSSGNIGDIFRFDAKELFIYYASRCEEKEKIAEIILKLNNKDDYGIRDNLIDCAAECLPEPVIRKMIAAFQKQLENVKNEYEKNGKLRMISSLARQIKDAELFKTICVSSRETLSSSAVIDIAAVYLESGNPETAHAWLNKIRENEPFKENERNMLLLEIYKKQGNYEKQKEILYKMFKSSHSVNTLKNLLDVVGIEKQDEIIKDEISCIMESDNLNETDVQFMIETGKTDDAETYLLKHADELNGNRYGILLSIAKTMETEKRYLITSIIYRSLLTSILENGYPKAYIYGAQYLSKLDKLAPDISDWKNFSNHETFKSRIHQAHKLKHAFWSKYTGVIHPFIKCLD